MFVEFPDGPRLYYEVTGHGPPVLMIAGTGCDHRWWAMQVESFSRRHTVITCDMRGAGQSTVYADSEDYDARRMASDVAHLVGHLDLGPVHVMGHSLGSCIVQELALNHPDQLLSAQMHATWAHADEWLARAFVGTMEYIVGRGDPQFAWKTVAMWVFSPRYLSERSPDRVREVVSNEFITNPHLDADRGLLGHLHADRVHDTRARLHELRVPTLVTAGEFDVSIPPRYGQWVAEQIPRSRYHLFKGERSAHAYTMEMSEEFDHVCTQFIADHP